MEGELKAGFYWVRYLKPSKPEAAYWTGFTWQWPGVDDHPRPAEVLEPIPTRDELRELREKAGKWDAAQAICDEYVDQFEHGDDVRGYMDQMGFLPKHRDNPRKATP